MFAVLPGNAIAKLGVWNQVHKPCEYCLVVSMGVLRLSGAGSIARTTSVLTSILARCFVTDLSWVTYERGFKNVGTVAACYDI